MSATFGHRLVRWREAAGLTQGELAGRVGVTPTYIGNLEREVDPTGIGEKLRPVVEVVDAIARALSLPLAEVRCAAGYEPPADSPASCEVVVHTFGESDFATLQSMYERLDAERRRTFQRVLEMVSRELEALLKEQGEELREDTPPERRRRVSSGRQRHALLRDVSHGQAAASLAGSKVPDEP